MDSVSALNPIDPKVTKGLVEEEEQQLSDDSNKKQQSVVDTVEQAVELDQATSDSDDANESYSADDSDGDEESGEPPYSS